MRPALRSWSGLGGRSPAAAGGRQAGVGRAGPGVVVALAPRGKQPAGMGQVVDICSFRNSSRIPPMVIACEHRDECVLLRLAGSDELPGHAAPLDPAEHRPGGHLGTPSRAGPRPLREADRQEPIVAHDQPWWPTPGDHNVELAHRSRPGDRGVSDGRETFAAGVVDDHQNADATAMVQAARDEVQGPAVVSAWGIGSRVPEAHLRPQRRHTVSMPP